MDIRLSMGQTKKTTRINSTINASLEQKFRETVYKTKGFKRGNLQLALEEAIKAWIDSKKKSG